MLIFLVQDKWSKHTEQVSLWFCEHSYLAWYANGHIVFHQRLWWRRVPLAGPASSSNALKNACLEMWHAHVFADPFSYSLFPSPTAWKVLPNVSDASIRCDTAWHSFSLISPKIGLCLLETLCRLLYGLHHNIYWKEPPISRGFHATLKGIFGMAARGFVKLWNPSTHAAFICTSFWAETVSYCLWVGHYL